MNCKNIHCRGIGFIPVIEMDNNIMVGVKCRNCGARYSIDELEIKESANREGFWNSVKWFVSLNNPSQKTGGTK